MAASLILIVEDDAELGTILEEVIESFGYRQRRVTSGAGALAAIEDERPLVALVDWSALTDPDQVAKRFFAERVPIILATGTEQTQARGRRLGARAVLEKPYSVESLLAALERALTTRNEVRPPDAGPPP
jgi:DNA-binding response OmpR family regulator